MPRVQAPDGTQIDFPETMQQTDIETAMGRLYPSPGSKSFAPPVPKPPLPTALRSDSSQLQRAFPGATAPVQGTPIMPAPMAMPSLVAAGLSKLDRESTPSELERAFPGAKGPIQGAPIMPKPGTEPALARAANEAIPSTARAGENFERVMQGARNVPINTAEAGDVALRAKELAGRGASLPKVANDFLKRATEPGAPPINYEEGRDFASNAGRLSVRESMKANPAMGRQVSLLARALDTANRGAAEQAGLAKEYDAAMKEYRQAQQLKTVGKVAGKAALGAVGAAGAVELARKVLGSR